MAYIPYPAYIHGPQAVPQLVTPYLDCNVQRPNYHGPRPGATDARLQSEHHAALYDLDIHHYEASRGWNGKWTEDVRLLSRLCHEQIAAERAAGPYPQYAGYVPPALQHSYALSPALRDCVASPRMVA
eukprot:TRINITY_DN72766_c0_g1_i1.p4 TRINITY_DN72766_c0_g1~~TRINITY_DN72766_c0_g1_i1.p4  ORF type:complete len:128 (+),score=25.54 TRINITY_DN72766_c0_g1_i1:80-463(+)